MEGIERRIEISMKYDEEQRYYIIIEDLILKPVLVVDCTVHRKHNTLYSKLLANLL